MSDPDLEFWSGLRKGRQPKGLDASCHFGYCTGKMASKKDIREHFRKSVFTRDRHRCVMCDLPATADCPLDAHHITDRTEMPNGGYVQENGISLCPECHLKAEVFHQSEGWDWEEGFHPNSLYYRIGSSPEEAVRASEKLK